MVQGNQEVFEAQKDSRHKIAIITDAWEPQTNGVVTTYRNTTNQLEKMNYYYMVVSPYSRFDFKLKRLSGYKEIEVVLNPWRIKSGLDYFIEQNWKIHVATEGPLGLFARLYLCYKKYPFTTCYHSKFPEFINARTKLPASWFYPYFRWFHKKSKCMMVPTPDMKTFMETKGFKNVKVWTRGVDSDLFRPTDSVQPYILCVSRVSHEKNLEAFCELKYPNKVIVGDGPHLNKLKATYPNVLFVGKKTGNDLARYYAEASAFVFPSKEDTFGIVILEAISSGVPVASYPCPGSNAVLDDTNGCISEDLDYAVSQCLMLNRKKVYESSKKWTWLSATKNFLQNIC